MVPACVVRLPEKQDSVAPELLLDYAAMVRPTGPALAAMPLVLARPTHIHGIVDLEPPVYSSVDAGSFAVSVVMGLSSPSPSSWARPPSVDAASFALFIDMDSVAPFPPTWARPASVDAGSFAASSVVVESSATALPLLSVLCSTERTQPSYLPRPSCRLPV